MKHGVIVICSVNSTGYFQWLPLPVKWTRWVFSPAVEEDFFVIKALAFSSKMVTSKMFRFVETHPAASVRIRVKLWRNESGEDISPGSAKHVELMYSSNTEEYGVQAAAFTRQNLIPTIILLLS